MNKLLFSGAFAALVLTVFAFTAPENPVVTTANINTAESYVGWTGYKVTGKHHGKVQLKSGELKFEGDKLVGGSFEINMHTISCEDLSGEWADKLVGHLKSEDFFGVTKYPVAKFEITQVISRGTPGSYKIVGNLTIKDTTKSIKFNADMKETDGKSVTTADITIDRSEYDIRYGSGSFFDNLGDKTIYDEFDLSVNLVNNK